MPINRVEALTYGVEDIALGSRYFEDLGLEVVERGRHGVVLRMLENQTIELREAKDPTLPATNVPGSAMREVTWGVDTKAALDALGAELAKDRAVHADPSGKLHTVDESGFPIAFAVSAPTPIHSEPILSNVSGSSLRVNRPLKPVERVRPIRILHVGYSVGKEHYQAANDFYYNRLKFRLTDRIVPVADFMRCETSRDHHNLVLFHRENKIEYGHFAFEVRDIDEIIVGGQYMKSKGWTAGKTPSRHILGSNLNWFFHNPCGGNVEFTADFDQVDDQWVPRIFEKHPGVESWQFDLSL
jgi:catechol 2,3-dioxygenase-like lactoylglutathione lyase family enzyme